MKRMLLLCVLITGVLGACGDDAIPGRIGVISQVE